MSRNIENKLDRIVIKLKKRKGQLKAGAFIRNPLVEIVMKKGSVKHKNKKKEAKYEDLSDFV